MHDAPTHYKDVVGDSIESMEAQVQGMVQRLLLLVGYERTQQYIKYVIANVVRQMWRANGGIWTQEQIGEVMGVSREWVNHLLKDKRRWRRPSPPDGEPRVDAVLFTILCGSRCARSHGDILDEASQFISSLTRARLAAETIALLGAWVSSGVVQLESLDGNDFGYRLAPDVRLMTLPSEPQDHVRRLTRRLALHLEFHASTCGQSGIGPRMRQVNQAKLTVGLAEDAQDVLGDTVLAVLQAFEEGAAAENEDQRRPVAELRKAFDAACERTGDALHRHRKREQAAAPFFFEVITVASNMALAPASPAQRGV